MNAALSGIFAIVAALLFALSASLQQTAARGEALTGPRRSPARFLLDLVRQRRWLAGMAANLAGFGVHAVALRLGAIPVVQALLVAQLLFALPLAAFRRRIRLLRRDWTGTALVCVGLIVLVMQHISHETLRSQRLAPVLLGVAGLVALIAAAASCIPVRHTQNRAALFGIGAGCCSAMTAVLVVVGTEALPLITWPLLAIALSTLVSGLFAQAAFASGSLPTAFTAMTITDPVVSYLATAVLFVTATRPNPLQLVVAAVLVTAGVVLLANSPTLHDERDRTVTPRDPARLPPE
ncbi:MAG: DMT family transporter [Mycobacteriaceae bacterium]|nr:DMT family transporter [Mycobacteriaceae bacterium]